MCSAIGKIKQSDFYETFGIDSLNTWH